MTRPVVDAYLGSSTELGMSIYLFWVLPGGGFVSVPDLKRKGVKGVLGGEAARAEMGHWWSSDLRTRGCRDWRDWLRY